MKSIDDSTKVAIELFEHRRLDGRHNTQYTKVKLACISPFVAKGTLWQQ